MHMNGGGIYILNINQSESFRNVLCRIIDAIKQYYIFPLLEEEFIDIHTD